MSRSVDNDSDSDGLFIEEYSDNTDSEQYHDVYTSGQSLEENIQVPVSSLLSPRDVESQEEELFVATTSLPKSKIFVRNGRPIMFWIDDRVSNHQELKEKLEANGGKPRRITEAGSFQIINPSVMILTTPDHIQGRSFGVVAAFNASIIEDSVNAGHLMPLMDYLLLPGIFDGTDFRSEMELQDSERQNVPETNGTTHSSASSPESPHDRPLEISDDAESNGSPSPNTTEVPQQKPLRPRSIIHGNNSKYTLQDKATFISALQFGEENGISRRDVAITLCETMFVDRPHTALVSYFKKNMSNKSVWSEILRQSPATHDLSKFKEALLRGKRSTWGPYNDLEKRLILETAKLSKAQVNRNGLAKCLASILNGREERSIRDTIRKYIDPQLEECDEIDCQYSQALVHERLERFQQELSQFLDNAENALQFTPRQDRQLYEVAKAAKPVNLMKGSTWCNLITIDPNNVIGGLLLRERARVLGLLTKRGIEAYTEKLGEIEQEDEDLFVDEVTIVNKGNENTNQMRHSPDVVSTSTPTNNTRRKRTARPIESMQPSSMKSRRIGSPDSAEDMVITQIYDLSPSLSPRRSEVFEGINTSSRTNDEPSPMTQAFNLDTLRIRANGNYVTAVPDTQASSDSEGPLLRIIENLHHQNVLPFSDRAGRENFEDSVLEEIQGNEKLKGYKKALTGKKSALRQTALKSCIPILTESLLREAITACADKWSSMLAYIYYKVAALPLPPNLFGVFYAEDETDVAAMRRIFAKFPVDQIYWKIHNN